MTEVSFPYRLGFIGIGAIGEALIVGLIESGYTDPILISSRNEMRSAGLEVRFDNVRVESNTQSIVDNSDWVIIAVLPEQAREVLLRLNFRKDQRLISLVAGISIDELKILIVPLQKAHRIIPLPPIEFGIGPLPVCPPDSDIKSLFENCASVIEIEDEERFSVFSAASGLMAAHHQLTASVARWMTDQGVDPANATMYASNIFRALSEIESRTPAEQIHQLADDSTTAGGLNEQALKELRQSGWFDEARASLDRLYERVRKGM